jgi:uncharacterized protein
MITRILFWLALVFLIMMAIRSKLRGFQQSAPPAAPPRQQLPEPESMLCCAHCGVHYPASESVSAAGRDYCSSAHARLPQH